MTTTTNDSNSDCESYSDNINYSHTSNCGPIVTLPAHTVICISISFNVLVLVHMHTNSTTAQITHNTKYNIQLSSTKHIQTEKHKNKQAVIFLIGGGVDQVNQSQLH